MSTTTTLDGWVARWLDTALVRGNLDTRPELAQVFSLAINGEMHSVASDGLIALAVVEGDGRGDPLAAEMPEKPAGVIRGYFGLECEWAEIDVDALRAFAGPAELPHLCECKHCGERMDDEPWVPMPRAAWVGDAHVDLALVAELLAEAPSGTVWVASPVRKRDGENLLVIRGDGWQGLVMGRRRDAAPDDAPRFPLTPAASEPHTPKSEVPQ